MRRGFTVVMPDGTVGRARITRSLDKDLGLDAQALETVKTWRFEPGTLKGEAVPVVMDVTLEFRLH
jgi:TonB family protein